MMTPLIFLGWIVSSIVGYHLGKWVADRRKAQAPASSGRDPNAHAASLDAAVGTLFRLHARYDGVFALALIEHPPGEDNTTSVKRRAPLATDRVAITTLISDSARETDTVIRCGDQQFALLMPETTLEGAAILADRLRRQADELLGQPLVIGITAVLDGDHRQSLLDRAESALSMARDQLGRRVMQHNGRQVEPIEPETLAAAMA